MEKYYRVSDVNAIIEKLAKEPAYYHEGEDFYNGVCAVDGELMCLEPVEITSRTGTWVQTDNHRWKCSSCRKETDLPHYTRACFCFNCGAKMLKESIND